MSDNKDKMHVFDDLQNNWLKTATEPFWTSDATPALDYQFLVKLLEVPVLRGDSVRSGVFANALDLWIAREFEHAGFEYLWPGSSQPRAVDPSLSGALNATTNLSSAQIASLLQGGGAQGNANVMGSVYTKQVDVGMSNWLSGPELLVSTKTMSGSFGKNLANRFEEAYGDVKNLRERYPLAAHGFVFLAKDSILDEQTAFDKAVHMLRQLSRNGEVYDAVALLLVDWDNSAEVVEGSWKDLSTVQISESSKQFIPDDLSCEHFFSTLISIILSNSPIDVHLEARRQYKQGSSWRRCK